MAQPNKGKDKGKKDRKKKDKNGNVIDDPVKFNDHAMDAGRYLSYSKEYMDIMIGRAEQNFDSASFS